MLQSTAAFINATGGNDGDNPTEISRSDVDVVVRTLLSNDAYTILDIQEGMNKFGTSPIRNSFFALCSTELTGNLDNVNGFTHVSAYPSPANILPTEYGAISNLRFLISSIGAVSPNASNLGNDVYSIFCVGMEAYACIEQNGYSAQFVYLPPSIAGGPLALNASVGYKFAEVPKMISGHIKSLLIDLEALLWGDKAEGSCHGERLSEENPLGYAIV